MNYKKQLFHNYRKQCVLAREINIHPDQLKIGGKVTIDFIWTSDPKTNEPYESMVIVYHNKPLVQRISNSNTFTTDTLYRLACEAERYALNEA